MKYITLFYKHVFKVSLSMRTKFLIPASFYADRVLGKI